MATTERFRLRSCATKIGHPTRRAAKRAARLTFLSGGGGRLHAYQCRFCTRWHIGHPMRHPHDRTWSLDGQTMVERAPAKGEPAEGARVTQGQAAEQLVVDRFRAALTPDYRLFANVASLGRTAKPRGLRERAVVALSKHQIGVMKQLRGNRRTEIVRAAGTGNAMLAPEKACRLARQGWEWLLLCFTKPLSRILVQDAAKLGRPTFLKPG